MPAFAKERNSLKHGLKKTGASTDILGARKLVTKKGWPFIIFACLLISNIFVSTSVLSQETKKEARPKPSFESETEEELAKQSQSPITRLKTVTIDNGVFFGVGPKEKNLYNLNAGVTFPINLGEIDIINRWFLPFIFQEANVPGEVSRVGFSDLNIQAILSPSKPRYGLLFGEMMWGIGLSAFIPTSTDKNLGSEKFSIGPVFAMVRSPKQWVFGYIVQNVWSISGDEDRADVNEFLFQYFAAYNMINGWYLGTVNTVTANWKADNKNRWVVPIGAGVGKVFRFGRYAADLRFQATVVVIKPEFGPDSGFKFTIRFLFP